jgi:hypothetical protein
MSDDFNGYLDTDQSIIDFYVRECGNTFGNLMSIREDDPITMLIDWNKDREKSKLSSYVMAGVGGLALVTGVLTGAMFLAGTGVAVAATCGWLGRGFGKAKENGDAEIDFLRAGFPVLDILHKFEADGHNPRKLAMVYDYALKSHLAGGFNVRDGEQLKEFFAANLRQLASAETVKVNGQTAIGVQTQLQLEGNSGIETGVETQVQLPQTQIQDQTLAADYEPTQVSSTSNIPSPVDFLIGERPRTGIIAAVSGGGKDIILSNFVRRLIQQKPDYKVVVIECKSDLKEKGYYSGLKNVSVHHLNIATCTDGELNEFVDSCLDEFNAIPEKAFLICNEATQIRDKSSRYVDVITGLISSGDSREKFSMEAGLGLHLDDLGIKGNKSKLNSANRSKFRIAIISWSKERQQTMGILKARYLEGKIEDHMREVEVMEKRSPIGRAWSDGSRWYAMPELPNYSGYNRDTRSFISGSKAAAVEETPVQILERQYSSNQVQTTENDAFSVDGLDDLFEDILDPELLKSKLLKWIEGTGKKHEVDGWIHFNMFQTKFRVWEDGKTTNPTQKDLVSALKYLVENNEVEFKKGKGVKAIEIEDDLGFLE